MGLRTVARNSLNPGTIAALILALGITTGAGCSNSRDTPGTIRETPAISTQDSVELVPTRLIQTPAEPVPTGPAETAVQPDLPEETAVQPDTPEETKELITPPTRTETKRPANTQNNICWRTPQVQEQIIDDLNLPSCQLINEGELFRVRELSVGTPELKPGDFDHMPNLEELDIELLRELPQEGTFEGLSSLKELVIDLTRNDDPNFTITEGTFNGLENLTSLKVTKTSGFIMEGHPLTSLEQIEGIQLKGIREISTADLAGLDQLYRIKLIAPENDKQDPRVIPRDLIAQLPKLRHLQIQGFEWPASMEAHSLETICRMKNWGSIPGTVLTIDGKVVQYMDSERQDGRETCLFKVEDQIEEVPLRVP